MAVGFLRDLQVPQHASRLVARADGQKARPSFDEIPRPDEVISAKVVVAFGEAPRNRQAGDHAALEAFRFMCAQDGGTQVIQRAARRFPRRTGLKRFVPGLPGSDVLRLRRVEVFHETDECVLTGFHRCGTEAECEDERDRWTRGDPLRR